jgi:arabinofuranosyltransferase
MTGTATWLYTRNRVRVDAALFVIGLTLSWIWSWHYLPSPLDDSFITYRYSERLLDGKGLTWNDGEHVEGYSNLLWLLLIAAGGIFQSNLALVAWILGLLANAAVLVSVVWTFGRSGRGSTLSVGVGLILFSLSSSFAFWGIVGLETPLVEALLAWGLATSYRMSTEGRSWLLPSFILGFLSITRPDAIVLGAGVALALVLRSAFRREGFRQAYRLISIPVLFFTAQTLFRLTYYGSPFPNTAYAKIAFTTARLWVGMQYVAHAGASASVPLVATVGLICALWRAKSAQILRHVLIFLVPAVLWSAYIAIVGGDIFPYYRMWMPVFVCIVFTLCALVESLPIIRPRLFGAVLLAFGTAYLGAQAIVNPWNVPAGNSSTVERLASRFSTAFPDFGRDPMRVAHRVISDCLTIGELLRDTFGDQQPLLAVNYAGCMPFASKLPAVDMLGLNDFYIAHHRPSDIGTGFPAHELGDGVYVLSRKPDLLTFCVPATGAELPCFRSETELARLPEFKTHYRLIYYRSRGVDASIWTRIEDGPLGIVRTESSIRIPGFLLTGGPGVRAVRDSAGKAVASLEAGIAEIQDIYFPIGTWNLSLESDPDEGLTLSAVTTTGLKFISEGTLRIKSSGQQVSLYVSGAPALIRGIVAQRLRDE